MQSDQVETKREDWRKLMRGYAAFQLATALLVASKAAQYAGASRVVSLLAISILSTIALGGLIRLTEGDEKRNPRWLFGICWFFAFVPSLWALSILLLPASRFAAIALPSMAIVWFAIIVLLRAKEQAEEESECQKTPNKAPEPTPTSVMPRANESRIE